MLFAVDFRIFLHIDVCVQGFEDGRVFRLAHQEQSEFIDDIIVELLYTYNIALSFLGFCKLPASLQQKFFMLVLTFLDIWSFHEHISHEFRILLFADLSRTTDIIFTD